MGSVVLKVSFPLGRYHGTAWLRGHNEGVVDWPPAPWRVLRALVATWKSYLEPVGDSQNRAQDGTKDSIQEGDFLALLDALKTPPVYHVPWATLVRTCHYAPLMMFTKGRGGVKTAILYDTFAAFDPEEPLYIKWDVDWDDDDPGEVGKKVLAALSKIAERLPYLGRAESICTARLLGGDESWPGDDDGWLKPSRTGVIELPQNRSVLHIEPEKVLAPIEDVKGKDLLRCLLAGVDEVRKKCRSGPPEGARWVWYPLAVTPQRREGRIGPAVLVRPGQGSTGAGEDGGKDAWRCHGSETRQDASRTESTSDRRSSRPLEATAGEVSEAKERPLEPFAVRWGIASSVPTPLKLAVLVADAMHRAAARALHDCGITVSPYVLGMDGDVTMKGHRHIHWIALPGSRDGKMATSVVAYSRCRLNDEELLALERINRIFAYSGSHPLSWIVRLQTYGEPKDVVPELVGPARHWVSLTPYASPRLSLDEETCRGHILRDLGNLGLPTDGLVKVADGVHGIAWSEFRRYRGGQRLDKALPAAGYRIDFGEGVEVSGPIVLGRLRHFGLGVFWPADDEVDGARADRQAG